MIAMRLAVYAPARREYIQADKSEDLPLQYFGSRKQLDN